jgi:DNA polymerase-1
MAMPLKDKENRYYEALAGLFVPKDKYVLQFDIKQAEVRLAAMLSKSNDLASFLASGQDAYMAMAKQAYGVANKDTRQKAKRATLASIYEEGPRAFSEKHGVSYDEAKEILDQFRKSFPQIKTMSNKYMNYAKAHHFINLFTGRKIHFASDDDRLYRSFNQEVQGGIAELMRDFMFRTEKRLPGHLIGQIHDSLVLEFDLVDVSPAMIEDTKKTLTEELVHCLPESAYNLTNPRIPLLLDAEPFEKKFNDEY